MYEDLSKECKHNTWDYLQEPREKLGSSLCELVVSIARMAGACRACHFSKLCHIYDLSQRTIVRRKQKQLEPLGICSLHCNGWKGYGLKETRDCR